MHPYLILLRGLMPTGKNKVLMAPLRDVLTQAGFEDVQTYIQSGNVLVRSVLSGEQVEAVVREAIRTHFGGDIVVVARTPFEIKQLFDDQPFKDEDTAKIHFTLLRHPPPEDKIEWLRNQVFLPDTCVVTKEAVYSHCPVAHGLTRLNTTYIERVLGVSATTRNYRTISKLVELGEEYTG